MDAVLLNQQSQDIVLRAIYTSVEMTVRRAARDQREGRSMLFDEMRAMEAPTAAVPFPRAEVVSRSLGARVGSSNCGPRGVDDKESMSGASEVCVRSHFSVSLPDLI